MGATVGSAHPLFGAMSGLPADTPVWICVLTGEVEHPKESQASQDLANGGFVAYEVKASTLERLASRSESREWKDTEWERPEGWGQVTWGFLLFRP